MLMLTPIDHLLRSTAAAVLKAALHDEAQQRRFDATTAEAQLRTTVQARVTLHENVVALRALLNQYDNVDDGLSLITMVFGSDNVVAHAQLAALMRTLGVSTYDDAIVVATKHAQLRRAVPRTEAT